MSNPLRKLYQPQFFVKDSLKRGEIPPASEAYPTAFATAWAAIVETFLIALIGMADTIMVSAVGDQAIAAVGLVTQPRYLVQTLVLSLNIAITSICARRKGEGNREGAIHCLKQGLLLSAGFSLLLSLIAVPLATPLLKFSGANADTMQMARDYFIIILLGLPLSNLSLTISSAQRGIGEMKASMFINMTANIVNIFFNYMLINGIGFFPKMGVRGAALATVIGYAAGLVVALFSVRHESQFLYIGGKEGWKFEKHMLQSMYTVTSGSFVEQVCIRFGFILYGKVVAGLGTIMLAAHQILMNIMSLSFSFGEGFGIAASSLMGQNMGAKRPDLSIVYGKICQRMTLISSALLFVVFGVFGETLIRLFSDNSEIIEIGKIILVIIGFIIFAQSSQMVYMGALRGAGDTKYTAVVSLISIVIVRPIVAYVLAYPLGMGLVGAWLALVADQLLRLLLTERRFSSGKWMGISL